MTDAGQKALNALMVTAGRCVCRCVPLPRELLNDLERDAEALVSAFEDFPNDTIVRGPLAAHTLLLSAAMALLALPDRTSALAALRAARELVAAIRAGEVPSHLAADPGDRTWPGRAN